MTERVLATTFALATIWLGVVSTPAQISDTGKCPGPIYDRKEITSPAKILLEPDFAKLHEALGNDASGHVKMVVILCRSGRITDIKLIDSQPSQLGPFVAAAVSLLSFKPAEMNWHTVSQRQQFEFSINESGSEIGAAAAAGRLVDEVDVMGNRRLTKEQIMESIKIRPGDSFSPDQAQRDLSAVLATGYFDSLRSRVTVEDAVRGGVRVMFEVVELPLITEIKFQGLRESDQFAIVNEFAQQRLGMRKGAPIDTAKLKKATRIIEQFLAGTGWVNVKADVSIERTGPTEVTITFKISGQDFRR